MVFGLYGNLLYELLKFDSNVCRVEIIKYKFDFILNLNFGYGVRVEFS